MFQSSMGFWGNLSEKLSTRRYCLTTYHRRNLWQICIMAGYFILRSLEWKGKLKVIESLLKTLAPPPPPKKKKKPVILRPMASYLRVPSFLIFPQSLLLRLHECYAITAYHSLSFLFKNNIVYHKYFPLV